MIYSREFDIYLQNSSKKCTGCPKKMFISKKGAQLTNEHFFWDTWYIKINYMLFYIDMFC